MKGSEWLASAGLPIVKGDALNDMEVTMAKPETKHCRFFHNWYYGYYIHPRLHGRYERHCLDCPRTERKLYNPEEWVRYDAAVEQSEATATGGTAIAEKWAKR